MVFQSLKSKPAKTARVEVAPAHTQGDLPRRVMWASALLIGASPALVLQRPAVPLLRPSWQQCSRISIYS